MFDTLTSGEVADKLKIRDGQLGAQAVVVGVAGWSGFAPSDLWEWLKSRLETRPNG